MVDSKTTKKPRTKKKRVAKKVNTKRGDSPAVAAQKYVSMTEQWPWPLRPMQQDAVDAFDAGIRRLGLFWHRRAGKDVFGMSLARREMRARVGSYVHFFPKHVHARRALWRGVDPRKGARFVDVAFGDIEQGRNNQDMTIEAYNGSTWSLLGSDNYDSTVIGGNVVGVVFSEWALCNPSAWDYIRPILRENNGWAMFITTFRGRNHAWQMYQKLQGNPDWYIDLRTIEQTSEIDGGRIISDEDVAKDRADGMKESLIQQEYYCNPEATADGAVYGKETARLADDKTRHAALYDPQKPVYCVWTLDLPVHASYLLIQPGDRPAVLGAHIDDFTTLAAAVAKAEQHRYRVNAHIIHGSQRDYLGAFNDLDRMPQILSNSNPVLEHAAASSFLERCAVDMDKSALLFDSLGGYVRRERFNTQVADMDFDDQAVDSWHGRLVSALETYAAWAYNGGSDGWISKPNYQVMDRIARTVTS